MESVFFRVGAPLVGLMCEVDEVDEKVSQMGLCWWRYGGPNVRGGSVLLICLYNLIVRPGVLSLYGKLDLMNGEWMGMRCVPD